MAGREIGIRFTFLVIFGIPVNQIRYKRSYRFLDAEQRSALGSQCGRIGRDFILGDRLGDCDRMVIQLGPVPLDIFEWFETSEGKRLLQMTAALCVSAYQSFSIEWLIEDAQQAPRLGKPVENSRLGLNFHLGRKGSS
jgi:predicted component of type VI protein secretion system